MEFVSPGKPLDRRGCLKNNLEYSLYSLMYQPRLSMSLEKDFSKQSLFNWCHPNFMWQAHQEDIRRNVLELSFPCWPETFSCRKSFVYWEIYLWDFRRSTSTLVHRWHIFFINDSRTSSGWKYGLRPDAHCRYVRIHRYPGCCSIIQIVQIRKFLA